MRGLGEEAMKTGGRYSRRVTVTAALCIVLVLSAVTLKDVSFGRSVSTGERRFSIVVELFGSDAEKIERTITVPIEEALAAVPCITSLRSVSRYGYSRTDITVSSRCDPDRFYLALRDAVDRAYRGFPRSVQKPRIFGTGSSSRPVFIAAFSPGGQRGPEGGAGGQAHHGLSRLRDTIEAEVKPAFKKIEGVGEIEIGGGALSQIHVAVSSAKSARYGITFREIAAALRAGNSEGPLGTLTEMGRERSLSIGSEYKTVEDIAATHIPLRSNVAPVRLSDIAAVTKGVRSRDSISRVDGERRVVLAVKEDGSSNIISLSRKLNQELDELRRNGFECTVVLDAGCTAREAVVRVVRAIFFSTCSVCLFLSLFAGRAREIPVLVLSLPVVLLTSAALLTAAGVSLSSWILSGFTVGIGLIIDSGIIIAEGGTSNARSPAGALISSAATTIAAAAPLFMMKYELPQAGAITLSLTVLIAAGTALPLIFMPAYLDLNRDARPGRTPRAVVRTGRSPLTFRILSRVLLRRFYRTVKFAVRRKRWVMTAAAVVTVAAMAATTARGIDFSPASGGETVYVHIEGKTAETVQSMDGKAGRIAAALRGLPGIERVGTTAKRGSAEMTITFDPIRTTRQTVEESVERAGEAVPGCFVYIPENGGRVFEVTISGSDIPTLKRIARRSAGLLTEQEMVEQVVFHFKDDLPAYRVRVDHNRAGRTGWSTAEIGSYLNRNLYGPPAVKWRLEGREIDIRVMGDTGAVNSGQDLAAVPLPVESGGVLRLGEITAIVPDTVPSAIYRKNRQRAVYFTVQVGGASGDGRGPGLSSTVETVRRTLGTIRLPAGYGFEMDKRIFELQRRFRLLGFLFVLSAVLIYMILAAQFESLLLPVPVMLSIPVSLSLPLLVRSAAGAPMTLEALIGIIILGGIIVNNAILITTTAGVSAGRGACSTHRVVRALRARLRPLLLTSGTTVLSSVPLIISSAISVQTGDMAGTLAAIMIWGIVGSLLSAFLFLPAVLVLFIGGLLPARHLSRSASSPF
jgi:HAE1 family hydrophobic/amphiphilic exporter-1